MQSATKILIADDDEKFIRAVARHLRLKGYDVQWATDGFQALQVAQKLRPEIILLDVNMPAGGGIGTLERLKGFPVLASVPVIVMTGDRSPEVARTIKRYDCDVLWKPFPAADLITLIEQRLADSSQEVSDEELLG